MCEAHIVLMILWRSACRPLAPYHKQQLTKCHMMVGAALQETVNMMELMGMHLLAVKVRNGPHVCCSLNDKQTTGGLCIFQAHCSD